MTKTITTQKFRVSYKLARPMSFSGVKILGASDIRHSLDDFVEAISPAAAIDLALDYLRDAVHDNSDFRATVENNELTVWDGAEIIEQYFDFDADPVM